MSSLAGLPGPEYSAAKTGDVSVAALACIIYWQAKELNRVILECEPEKAGVDLDLLEHISPIGWENVVLYGEYVLNRDLIKG